MKWAPIFHIYQPPNWDRAIIEKVTNESYRPLCALFKKHQNLRCSMNMTGSLTEQLSSNGMVDVLHDLRALASTGQIEFLGSAQYHPILAKLPDEEIKRQIELNVHTNRKAFGDLYDPRGFWIPELCYDERVARIIRDFGFHWIVLDPVCLNAPLPNQPARFRINNVGLDVLFRNRAVSDSFFSPDMKSAKDFDRMLHKNHDVENHPLITALDGENLGHHRPELVEIFSEIIGSTHATFTTGSELLSSFSNVVDVDVRPGSWASRPEQLENNIPYILWDDPHNPIHERQWKLLHLAHQIVETLHDDPQYDQARTELDRRFMSDQFWWASAKPWWDAGIVKNLTEQTMTVLQKLRTVSPESLTAANTLKDEIVQLADAWEASGKVADMRRKYLMTDPTSRFMGGYQIH